MKKELLEINTHASHKLRISFYIWNENELVLCIECETCKKELIALTTMDNFDIDPILYINLLKQKMEE